MTSVSTSAHKQQDAAVGNFIQAMGMLVRRIRAAAASQDLSLTEWAVMARLAREGPSTTADLARAEGMKPQSMGATVATLESSGMVERKAHPTDGRQMNILLTPKGAAIRKRRRDAKHTWLAEAVAELDDHERKTLFKAGDIIRRLAER